MFTIYRYAPYASLQEQQNRSNRFPSVETRVKFYMSHWYAPPCAGNDSDSASAKIKYQLLSYNWTTRRRTVVLQMDEPNSNSNSNSTKQLQSSLLLQVESSTKIGHVFLLDRASLYQQKQEQESESSSVLHYYADDAFDTIVPLMEKYLNGTPLLTQWGDAETSTIGMYYGGGDAGGGGRSRWVTNPVSPHLK
jgi:hypothetical protein